MYGISYPTTTHTHTDSELSCGVIMIMIWAVILGHLWLKISPNSLTLKTHRLAFLMISLWDYLVRFSAKTSPNALKLTKNLQYSRQNTYSFTHCISLRSFAILSFLFFFRGAFFITSYSSFALPNSAEPFFADIDIESLILLAVLLWLTRTNSY